MTDDSWRQRAACRGKPTEWFFAGTGKWGPALEVCARCPVQRQCLDYVRHPERSTRRGDSWAWAEVGVWGGRTPRGRGVRRRWAERVEEEDDDRALASAGVGGRGDTSAQSGRGRTPARPTGAVQHGAPDQLLPTPAAAALGARGIEDEEESA